MVNINPIDLSNIQPSSLSNSSEQAQQSKKKTIIQLSEDSTLTSEQTEKLIQKVKILQQEQTPETDLELSSKKISQMEDQITQQEQPLKTNLDPSSEEIDLDEEDLFGTEETDDISDVGNKSEIEAAQIESEASHMESEGMAEQATSKETGGAKKETPKVGFERDVSKVLKNTDGSTIKVSDKEQRVANGLDEADHVDVEIDTETQEQSIVLSTQASAKMVQGVDRAVEKLKAQSVRHQTTTRGEEHAPIETTGKALEERKTLSLGKDVDGIVINIRMKEVNGLLGPIFTNRRIQSSNEAINSIFANIVNTDAHKMKFEKTLQAAFGCYGAFNENKKFNTEGKEEDIKKVAKEELKEEVVNYGSVDLPEENMRNFGNKFFLRVINEGLVTGPDGQPLKLTSAEIEVLQKEFTESFISYLISENLLRNQVQDKEENKPKKQITATLLAKLLSEQQGDLRPDAGREVIPNIAKTAFTTRSLTQEILENIQQKTAKERKEQEILEEFTIKQVDIKTREVNRAILKEDQVARVVLNNLVEHREVNIKKKDKIKISKDQDALPIDIVDDTRAKLPG